MSPELLFQTTTWVYTGWQLKKNLMAPFHGRGSTALRLQPLQGGI